MDLEKFERMVKLVKEDLSVYDETSSLRYHATEEAKVKNLIIIASKTLPDHMEFFKSVYSDIHGMDIKDVRLITEHILAILKMEKTSEAKTREMKIFETAEEKVKQAGFSFRKDDYTSTFHNLNTALELVLKDKLGIPTTITAINTSNIIDILIKHKVEPYLYLAEVRKHILVIDNKSKHQGYSPSKVDCINGIKAMEELISKLKNKEMELTEDIRNKIYEGL
jgi:HEPN domain-containing protein